MSLTPTGSLVYVSPATQGETLGTISCSNGTAPYTWSIANVNITVNPSGSAYYVDSVNGNDANDGTTPATAVKTIAQLNTIDAAANRSTWCFLGNSVFKEYLYLPRNNMTIGQYGAGTRPLFDCSDAISAGSWSKTAGRTNVYQATVPVALANSLGKPTSANGVGTMGAWETIGAGTPTPLTKVGDVATCDSTAGSVYAANPSGGTTTIYIHATDNTNPGSNGYTYEYTARGMGIDSYDVTGATITGVQSRRNWTNDGSIKVGKSCTITNAKCYDGGKHNFYMRTGSTANYVECLDRNYSAADSLFVYNEDTPAGEGITFNSCLAHCSSYDANSYGFYGHPNGSGTFGTVAINNCVAQHLLRGIECSNDTNQTGVVTVSNTIIDDCYNAFYLDCGLVATNVIVQNSRNTSVQFNAGGKSVTASGSTFDKGFFCSSTRAATVSLTNCYVGGGTSYILGLQGTTTLTLSGCSFGAIPGSGQAFSLGAGSTITSDNNSFVNPTSRGNYSFEFPLNTFMSWAGWKGLGYDTHSSVIGSLTLPTGSTSVSVLAISSGGIVTIAAPVVFASHQSWYVGVGVTDSLSATGSGTFTFTTDAAPLSMSQNAASSGTTATTTSMSVSAASGGIPTITYQWWRSTSIGSLGSQVAGATSLTLNDSGLTPNTTYYYVCVATDGAAATSNSNQVAVTTLLGALSISLVGFGLGMGLGFD